MLTTNTDTKYEGKNMDPKKPTKHIRKIKPQKTEASELENTKGGEGCVPIR